MVSLMVPKALLPMWNYAPTNYESRANFSSFAPIIACRFWRSSPVWNTLWDWRVTSRFSIFTLEGRAWMVDRKSNCGRLYIGWITCVLELSSHIYSVFIVLTSVTISSIYYVGTSARSTSMASFVSSGYVVTAFLRVCTIVTSKIMLNI